MSATPFTNRVFGAIIIRSINSNFNADFTHHPRTLPDGTVYSTDKALKYAIKDYFRKFNAAEEKLFYVKRFNERLNPLTLDETYVNIFGKYPKKGSERFSLFYFDGENVIGVVSEKPKAKEIKAFFEQLPEDSELREYSKHFGQLADKKKVVSKKPTEVKPTPEEEEHLFYIDKDDKPVKLEGDITKLRDAAEKLDEYLTGGVDKFEVLGNLMQCLDIRLFGATFAGETNISIHGPVQINHGMNRLVDGKGNQLNELYTEDILSPFRNPGEVDQAEKGASTKGTQTNLKEGHYVFHFSINPKNTEGLYELVNRGKQDDAKLFLRSEDISKLKAAMNNAVTALDSTRKIGTENEATIFVTFKQISIKVLPSFTELIDVTRTNGKVRIDCTRAAQAINAVKNEVEKVELYYDVIGTEVVGLDDAPNVKKYNILNNQEV
jgi:CRISPR-associated protein Csh2